MSAPGLSHVLCLYGDRQVDAQTGDSALAVALVKTELERRLEDRR